MASPSSGSRSIASCCPDVADGRDHEWAQQVAVSTRTFKPVALRETRDGEPGPGTTRHVLNLELLASGQGHFSAPKERNLDGAAYREGREPIALEEIHGVLGRMPVCARTNLREPAARAGVQTDDGARRTARDPRHRARGAGGDEMHREARRGGGRLHPGPWTRVDLRAARRCLQE